MLTFQPSSSPAVSTALAALVQPSLASGQAMTVMLLPLTPSGPDPGPTKSLSALNFSTDALASATWSLPAEAVEVAPVAALSESDESSDPQADRTMSDAPSARTPEARAPHLTVLADMEPLLRWIMTPPFQYLHANHDHSKARVSSPEPPHAARLGKRRCTSISPRRTDALQSRGPQDR